MKKQVDIEELLKWAYREELPKHQKIGDGESVGPRQITSAHGAAARAADMWCLPDNWFGVTVDLSAEDDPHPDAMRVGHAVKNLADLEIEIPDDWSPIGDLGDLGPPGRAAVAETLERAMRIGRDGRRWLKKTPERLIVHHAIMGGAPDWYVDPPRLDYVRHPNGTPRWFRRVRIPGATDADGNIIAWREIEADGFDEKSRRPYDDATRKQVLVPDPVDGLIGRAEYEVWRAALDVLIEDLSPVLEAHVLKPCERPWRPWETGDSPPKRILVSKPSITHHGAA